MRSAPGWYTGSIHTSHSSDLATHRLACRPGPVHAHTLSVVDLSGIIFVALAVGWALYLIPKALQQHEELARSRSVEDFSHRMRVFGRGLGRRVPTSVGAADPAPASRPAAPVAPQPAPVASEARTRSLPTREAARRAAARRRRVLAVLLIALVAVAVLAWRAIVPWWSVAIPGGAIVAFLAIARLSVRRQHRRAGASVAPRPQGSAVHGGAALTGEEPSDREDTVGVPVGDLAMAAGEPIADDGALWDPLPLNLPTYVGKPQARRTVRTIELTGMTSSGHNAADSALARGAEAAEGQKKDPDRAQQRRAVGE